MRKVFNAIINEYIKIFAKISTKIMLACIVALAVFWNVGSFVSSRQSDSYYDREMDFDTRIEEYSGMDDVQADAYRFMKEIGITESTDWRYTATNQATGEFKNVTEYDASVTEEQKSDAKRWYEEHKKAISDNDLKGYLQLRIRYTESAENLTEQEREANLWGLRYQLEHDIPPSRQSDRYNTLQQLTFDKSELLQMEQMPVESQEENQRLEKLKNDIALGEYVLKEEIDVYTTSGDSGNWDTFWPVFSNSTMLIMVINVLIIIVAGSMVSMEFSSGTIKFLLINPVKRWKILLAKYLSVLTVGMLMLFIYYFFNMILAGIFYGFGDIGAPFLSVADGSVKVGSSLLHVAWKYLLGSLGVLTMATFAFAVSSLVRNSALAIGLGVFLLLSGYGAVYVLASSFNMDWARYLLFANTDINLILNGQTPFIGHTVEFALIVTGVYMVVFLLTAWDAFVRQDVK